MKLNTSKCVAMWFGKKNVDTVSAVEYFIGGQVLQFVSSYRDLGVVVDCSLRFHVHVNIVVGKAGSFMGDLLRSTVCCSKDFMISLFVSQIRSLIDSLECGILGRRSSIGIFSKEMY